MNFDTGSDESGHKHTKANALLTQKNEGTFDAQTNIRLLESRVIQLVLMEINGRPLWDYLVGYRCKAVTTEAEEPPTTQGTVLTINTSWNPNEDRFEVKTNWLNGELYMEQCLVRFVGRLARKLAPFLSGPTDRWTDWEAAKMWVDHLLHTMESIIVP